MKIEAKYLDCLKEAVEKTVGKKMNTPRDFDLLSIYVYNLTNEHLSSTTLKRLWGYQIDQKESSPRILTLDTLARTAGFKDYASFLEQITGTTGSQSYFINNKHLYTSHLSVDEMVRLTWKPDRCVTIQYIGLSMFKVLKSQNSKLSQNDIFICERIVENQPLLLSNLIHDNGDPTNYICGKIDGVKYQLVEE